MKVNGLCRKHGTSSASYYTLVEKARGDGFLEGQATEGADREERQAQAHVCRYGIVKT